MRLSLDVLTIVLSHMVRRPDMLSVMCTCKAVYAAGVPALLKSSVVFSKKSKLISFCDFILVDAPTRARRIHHLAFFPSLGKIKDEIVEKFVQVLQHATGLEELEFHKCDNFVASDERISEAFAQLKSVKILRIQDADVAVVDMVKKMQSLVEYASISVAGTSNADQDPASILAPFQQSLRKLYAWTPEFTDDNQDISYPELHTLDVTFWNNIEMEPMVRAYPNTRNLSLSMQGYSDGGLEEDKDEIREKNEQAQEVARWEHLEHVVADDINLYLSALKADIDELTLRLNWESEAESITAILGDARPAQLTFSYETDWDGQSEHFTSLLEAASADITHLSIKVRSIDDPEEVINLLCDTIPTLPKLVSLSLEVAQKDVNESEHEVVARRFAGAASPLQTVILNLSRTSESAWHVERDEADFNDVTLRPFTEGESQKLKILA